MKHIRYIAILLLIWVSVPSQAASTIHYEPEQNAEVCQQNTPYSWRGHQYYTTGTYHDSVFSTAPKDTTVYTLNLTVHNTYIERKIELRKGSKVEIRGIWYDQPGEYFDPIPSQSGCDSILHITIIWAECFRQVEKQEMCEGNSLTWHGQTITKEGIYYDSLKTTQGYDSVYQLYVHTHNPFVQYDTIAVCLNQLDAFRWHGQKFTEAGDYYRTYMDHNHCDSTYYLHLTTPLPSPITSYTKYFCRNQGFIWRHSYFYEENIFMDTLINKAGCDSLVSYHFIPLEYNIQSDVVNHYPNVPIEWRGKVYTIDSIYQDTLVNQFGCDSIMELRLVTKYDLYRTITRCKGDTAMFGKEVIETECERHDTLRSIIGGDSIIHYQFSFTEPFYSREFISICSNEYVPWEGHYQDDTTLIVLHEGGIYRDQHHTVSGCDSTYEIEVKILEASIKDTTVLICLDTNRVDPIIWTDSKGKEYKFFPYQYLDTTIRDTMHHTLPTDPHEAISSEGFVPITGGCDSILNFRFIITDRCSEIDSIPMCVGPDGKYEPVRVDGKIYTEPGLYSNQLTSYVHQELLMLDSVHNFLIWVAPSDTSYDTVHVCECQLPYRYNNGQLFYNRFSKDYIIPFKNRYECDSIVHLRINVTPTYYDTIFYNHFCPGDTIRVFSNSGKVFTTIGTHRDTIHYGKYDCDSIFLYHITRNRGEFYTETHYLGVDSAYQWKGHHNDTIYTTSGTYYDSCKNVFGCDSIYQLRLVFAQPFYALEEDHVCSNHLPYIWHNKSLNKSGTYYDSLFTAYKLDSVYQLNLTVDPVYRDTIAKNFCYGDYFILKGKKYTTSGTYCDTLRNEGACDSIFTYTVSFISFSMTAPEEKHIPEGASYTWHNKTYDKTGYYYDTIRASRILDGGHACDSVIHSLHLVVENVFYKEQTEHVCSNHLPLIWHQYSINQSGVYWDSCKTQYGIDSVYKMTVTVDPIFADTIHHHMCQGETFTIHGKSYTTAGVYLDSLVTKSCGCDSIIYHFVSFTTAATSAPEIQHCKEGESVIWHNKVCSDERTYLDTLKSQWGCDSVYYSMRLIIDRAYYYSDSVSICQNEFPYKWHNRDLQKAGIYWDSCQTIRGLDSIYKLRLDTLPTSFYSYTHLMCEGDIYNFGTQVISKPGIYLNHQFKENGCDSIIRCIVRYAPHYFYPEEITYVDDSELPKSWHGKELWKEGYYFDSLTTQIYGCDSIHRVYLRKSLSYQFSEEKELCSNQLPYLWQGQNLTEAGVHNAYYHTQDGRDSIYTLNLIVHPADSSVLNQQICPGTTYSLYGKTYNRPGTYRDTLYTEEGCLHIVKLNLNFYNTTPSEKHYLLCPGDSILIAGKYIAQSGTYEEKTTSPTTGCDSIIRHIVGYHSSFYQDETKTINPGDTYTWHKDGQPWPLTMAGTYFDSCKNIFGCDSIYRLILTVNQVEYHFPTEVVYVCESALPFVWHNTSFYNDTTAQAKYLTRQGRDSIYTLELHVSRAKDSLVYMNYCQDGIYEIEGRFFDRSGQFTDTLVNSHGCDSIRVHYTINFYPRYSITQLIELKNGECYEFGHTGTELDTLICTSGTYYRHFKTANGCDSLVTLKVMSCSTSKNTTVFKEICENETFILNGQVISQSGTYYKYLKTADGCDSIVTLIVNIIPVSSSSKVVSTCNGNSYLWHMHHKDSVLTRSGVYIDSIPTSAGCYDFDTVKFTMLPSGFRDTLTTLCKGESYKYKGKTYEVDTTFLDTLPFLSSYGCDSIIRWHYQINQHCSEYDQYKRCSNEVKYIDGILVDHAGVYSVSHLTDTGKDSLYRFIVRDVPPYETFTPIANACDSATYKGVTYYARGAGQETFQVDLMHKTIEDGCDSIEHVTFTIYQSSPIYKEYATIADYQTYRFEGTDYNTSGTHIVRHLNNHNCDSIRELHLTVETTAYPEAVQYYYCKGDPSGIKIWGKVYYPTQDLIIKDTTRINQTPTIRTAEINVQEPFVINKFSAPVDQMLCSDEMIAFNVSYDVNGRSLPDFYQVDFQVGDLSIAPKPVYKPVNGKTTLQIELDGQGLRVPPGYYKYRIHFISNSCSISDTIIENNLILVRYPSDIMDDNWDNVVTLKDANANGGRWELQAPYTWQIRDKSGRDKTALVAPSDNAQPYLASNYLSAGDSIIVTLYRADYPQPIPSCPHVFEPVPYNQYQNPILIYPTVTSKKAAIHVEANQQGEYQVYNATGRVSRKGSIADGDNLIVMPASDGCYLLKVTTQDGTEAIERVIVH